MLCYLYLRASTRDQNASRAEQSLRDFAEAKGLTIVGAETENESGARLDRPALFKILNTAPAGAAILVEQVDRLSRLNEDDWQTLRRVISEKRLKIIALDLPTSHMMTTAPDEFTGRMFDAINGMLLDMLAAISRKDYTDRRRRQRQGIDAAKAKGFYTGRPAQIEKHAKVIELYERGEFTQAEIARLAGLGLTTTRAVIREHRAAAEQAAE